MKILGKTSIVVICFAMVLAISACKSVKQTDDDDMSRQFSAVAEKHKQTVKELLKKIHSELPKGWTVAYDPKYAWLEITRDEPVLSESALLNGPPDEKSELAQFGFAFRITTAMSPAEYHRLSAENVKIRKEINTLYGDLDKRHVFHKFDSFIPSTDSEKVDVARYKALKESLHRFPDFYYHDIGINWGLNSPNVPQIYVIDYKIRDECEQVREETVSLFSKYDSD